MLICRLKLILMNNHMSSKDLSKLTGISKASICRYVDESRMPKIDDCYKISEALNINIDQIWKKFD